MMHLVRLYLMCFDILEHGAIITYREKEHDPQQNGGIIYPGAEEISERTYRRQKK